MKTLAKYKDTFNINTHFNVYKCDCCGIEMMGKIGEDFEIELFEPKEKEVECIDMKTMLQFKKNLIESSDFYKDSIIFKCPDCGRVHKMSRDEFYRKQHLVDICGENGIIFHFDEKTALESDKFMKEHKNCCKEKLGKPFFSSNGGQFTYIITPTGLGKLITIKCNACQEQRDITNTKNW